MVYDHAGRTTHWRLARDEDVVVQSESAAWDVAITWSGLVWAKDPQPWPTPGGPYGRVPAGGN